ncbi:formylglycine-generating enzyme required for sulfatase activity [Cellulosimicrobium cellulans]|uniref:formylglycine-generating enzyme family protein n=1 Tax=Cellulosimicrobium cellulans TaxID=1710 RepID=UPI001956BAC1|nr:SUMF1/EgtB/PvdO family nonheme iron enzyme [Cellulosimicrobium cellulans]MBM7819690.1 formylglycine-generating enzyme required for sulfatase activity [Cellulosimicrobium cellulans]
MGVPLPDLVPVPAGRLDVVDARTRESRSVVLEPFHVARTAVTVGQHRSVLAADPIHPRPGRRPAVDDDVPVHGVTWFEAVLWCNAASRVAGLDPAYRVEGRDVRWDVRSAGYRLPTEAEWEHACRGGTSGPRYGPVGDVAWTADDGVDGPRAVATRLPNAFGLHDTLGNVWEWCWDYADTARYGEYRSLRGGGWADRPWSVRAGVRRGSAPDARIEDVGLRVVRGAVGDPGVPAAQGWSDAADRARAQVPGLLPLGWTPLTFPPAAEASAGGADRAVGAED